MKSVDLYLKILSDIRYNVFSEIPSLKNVETDSDLYNLICKVNIACNSLSSLIDVMRYEDK